MRITVTIIAFPAATKDTDRYAISITRNTDRESATLVSEGRIIEMQRTVCREISKLRIAAYVRVAG